MKLIKLTDLEGESLYIDPDTIVSLSRLPAHQSFVRGTEHGMRTSIRTLAGGAFLARETPDEIVAAALAMKAETPS